MIGAGQVWGPAAESGKVRRLVVLALDGDLVRFIYLGDQKLEEKTIAYSGLQAHGIRVYDAELDDLFDGEEDYRRASADPVNTARVMALLAGEGREFTLRALRIAGKLKRDPVHFARELVSALAADRAGAHIRVLQGRKTPTT